MRNGGHLEQIGSKRDENGWILDILKVLLTRFVDRLNKEQRICQRSQGWLQVFGPEQLEKCSCHWQGWWYCRKNSCVGKDQEIGSGHIECEWAIQRWVLRWSYKGKYIALNVYFGKEEILKIKELCNLRNSKNISKINPKKMEGRQ